MCTRSVVRAVSALCTVIAGISGIGRVAVAQTACSYDRCALHIEATPAEPFVSHLVQGIEARPVATLGFFASGIPLLASSPDSVRLPYETYRARQRTANLLFGVATAFTAASAVTLLSHTSQASRLGPPAVALDFGFWLGAVLQSNHASHALEASITAYNAALPDRR